MNINYINFLKHVIFNPETYHRRYDLDVEGDLIKRVALAALPFLALYRPVGSAMTWGMGGCRVISHLHLAFNARKEGWRFSREMGEVALAVFALAAGPLSLAVTTVIDTGKGAVHTAQFCWQGEYSKASEEALQTLASGFYLAFMATGTLEALLISTLIQAIICCYQAKGDIKAGRFLDAGAKLLMAVIRLYQANQYRELIERRNILFAIQRYQALVHQAMKGRAVRHLVHHSLADLNGQIDEKKVLLSDQGKEYNFGSHFHGFGKGLVKGANLSFRNTTVDGKEGIECEFKINHVFRSRLQKTLDELTKLSDKEMREILHFSGSHAETISVKNLHIKSGSQGSVYKVDVKGLGSISIGGVPKMPNLYDKVTIRMGSDKTLYDLHELMALTNLDTALCSSSKEDLDRLKIGQLFRTFFPREATPFERSESFFILPIQDLKAAIIKKAPQMKELFDTHLERIKTSEILPGEGRYQIDGLADKVHALGGRALTAAVTGARNDQDLYKRVASMLSVGMISQEMRDRYDLTAPGLVNNYFTGGADSVYTQIITENLLKKDPALKTLQYQSKVRMLISLKALETGTYQYFDDDWGTRLYGKNESQWNHLYEKRSNILELTKKLHSTPVEAKKWRYFAHEVMLKERIAPELFEGIVVDRIETRDALLKYLRSCYLVQKNQEGQETILGKAVDLFFQLQKPLHLG